jgi:hypothetical protein
MSSMSAKHPHEGLNSFNVLYRKLEAAVYFTYDAVFAFQI